MILDPDVVEGSSEGASAWSGRLSAKLMLLRAKVRDYAEGKVTLEELLEEAKVNLEDGPTKKESPITELLLNQIGELRHAISEHQRLLSSLDEKGFTSETGLVFTMREANKCLWEVLE